MTAPLTQPDPAGLIDRFDTSYEDLAAPFRPVFERITAGALDRERNRVLPFEPIEWLKAAGFGAVRLPEDLGGGGASITDLIRLLVELAAADPNITQALRGHFAFVEDRLVAPSGPQRDVWLARFAAGDLFGIAWTEIGDVPLGGVRTSVAPTDDPGFFAVNGEKFYSTGSIFADWIDINARRTDTGEVVVVAVGARAEGVTHLDDWDGFGQRTTGSGTSLYRDVRVPAEHLFALDARFRYQGAFYQLVHLATLAGIARAATAELVKQVRARTRTYSHGNTATFAADPQIQQVIGEVSAAAFAAEAVALSAANQVQRAHDAALVGDPATEPAANLNAELSTSRGQVIVSELVVAATSKIFNALGASGLRTDLGLDRFWRNARTIASHNPTVFKAKVIGDYETNGTKPDGDWEVGVSQRNSV